MQELTYYQKCLRIYNQLKAKSVTIKEEDYKWRLGSEAYAQIKDMEIKQMQGEYVKETPVSETLFKLQIEKAIDNPKCVELWENVTRDFL